MSTARDDTTYKKLPISKLKSLLSANGVIIPHVKDQPKEYYIKLYETHILKEPGSDDEFEGIEDQLDESFESSSAEERNVEATQPQYINPQQTTKNSLLISNKTFNTISNENKAKLPTSYPQRWRIFGYLVPLLLAVLVSLSLLCTVQDTPLNHTACHAVQRVLRVLSLGLYGHNTGAADY